MTTSTTPKALLIDITRCIGCHMCDATCKQIHNFPAEPEKVLSATSFTVVQERNGKFVRRLCMHCQDPACVSVCPVGALQKTEAGPVVYEDDKCIGCRYCMLACPFQVPAYQWDRIAPFVMKCDLCAARVARGEQPACVEACPAGATVFGTREEMLAEAQKRIRENPSGYVPRIYGAEEVGGTSVLFLSDVPFEKLGFVNPPQQLPMPTLTAAVISEVPTVVLVGGALLSALYWITQRRAEVALAESETERS
ncbi:MAG TPA: 4Fe-4S dicluster domain-containing protein [Candidatus Nitrosotenuis sp.]|nr:4Fe-4S dicluster domain-containing protein [Candidatus Nitrosotenuis sp.]